jgi:hypothetical protein
LIPSPASSLPSNDTVRSPDTSVAHSLAVSSSSTSTPSPRSAAASPPLVGRRPLSFAFSTHSNADSGNEASAHSGPSSLGFGLPTNSQRDWDSESAKQMLVERELTIADFDEALELKFQPQGSAGPVPTPPHKLNFSFKFKVSIVLPDTIQTGSDRVLCWNSCRSILRSSLS